MAQPDDTVVELVTDPDLAAQISDVAAITFPLACPPHTAPADIAAHVAAKLGPAEFRTWIESPDSDVLIARAAAHGPVIGYSLVHHVEPTAPDVCAVVTRRPVSELSKMYVLPDHHAHRADTAASHALMSAAVDRALLRGSVSMWLGVNQENPRAQRFYTKMGFTRAGTRTFSVNGSLENDYVLSRDLTD